MRGSKKREDDKKNKSIENLNRQIYVSKDEETWRSDFGLFFVKTTRVKNNIY